MILYALGEAEICDFEIIIMHEQIGGFHISMYNVPFPQALKSFEYFLVVVIFTLKKTITQFYVRYPRDFMQESRLEPLQYSQRMQMCRSELKWGMGYDLAWKNQTMCQFFASCMLIIQSFIFFMRAYWFCWRFIFSTEIILHANGEWSDQSKPRNTSPKAPCPSFKVLLQYISLFFSIFRSCSSFIVSFIINEQKVGNYNPYLYLNRKK